MNMRSNSGFRCKVSVSDSTVSGVFAPCLTLKTKCHAKADPKTLISLAGDWQAATDQCADPQDAQGRKKIKRFKHEQLPWQQRSLPAAAATVGSDFTASLQMLPVETQLEPEEVSRTKSVHSRSRARRLSEKRVKAVIEESTFAEWSKPDKKCFYI